MYESSKVAESIKNRSKLKGVHLKDMLLELKLSKNTLSNMYNGSMLKSDSLALIADYLDCSVDYLLGRADNPERSAIPKVNYVNNVNSDNNTIEQNYSTKTEKKPALSQSEECTELVRIYTALPFRQRVQLLSLAVELEQES